MDLSSINVCEDRSDSYSAMNNTVLTTYIVSIVRYEKYWRFPEVGEYFKDKLANTSKITK